MFSSYSHHNSYQLPLLMLPYFLNIFAIFSSAQCPPVQPPCRCAPSIHEPVALICENASTLPDILNAIAEARSATVCFCLFTLFRPSNGNFMLSKLCSIIHSFVK